DTHPDEEASNTIDMEFEVGLQIAKMLGYNTNTEHLPCAWGHMTSDGTTANYESLWNARAISFYPLAMKAAAKKLNLDLYVSASSEELLSQCSSWNCQNFSVDEVIALQKYNFQQLVDKKGLQTAKNFFKQVNQHRVEHMGMASFFAEHWDAKQPMLLIPATAHSSWKKSMRLLGFGTSQIIKLDVNNRMRLDTGSLERVLNNAEQKKIPIMAVVGTLGTSEFGSIDPLAEIVQLRKYFSNKGLNFYYHIDAAWGGYLSSLFRNEDDSIVNYSEIKEQFQYFSRQNIFDAFSTINEADSVSVDNQHLDYLPFSNGAFISRNQEVVNILSQDCTSILTENFTNTHSHLKQFDEYILEGTKSGANATACCVTHKILPLNKTNFGKLLSNSILSTEYFVERTQQIIENLKRQVNIIVPMEPDTNLVCLAINPINNHCLTRMNRFSKRVYDRMQNIPEALMLNKLLFCSDTSLLHSNLGNEDAQYLLEMLDIRNNSFVVNIEDPKKQTNSIHVLRHTLLNPWLLTKTDGFNAIDRYCGYLEKIILEVVNKESSNTLIRVGAR
ncbi:MAG: pyridoxal-dependent decarboxylase, partial [Gammaproteobacteria bacterium]|nr:pyridoxal-dependent decarboxylase [Gammaproteobacteria bacterium]